MQDSALERATLQKAMKRSVRRRVARVVGYEAGFVHGFFRGLAAPVELFRSPVAPYRTRTTDLQSMRSDWVRIGEDFRSVVTREHVKAAASRSR